MNWKRYSEIDNNLTQEEKVAMTKGLEEWLKGNDGPEEWGTTERMVAKDMFRAGWITCMVERGFFVKKKVFVKNREIVRPQQLFAQNEVISTQWQFPN